MKPDPFKGRRSESFKPWKKKFEAYCNSKRSGFRAALDWAAKQKAPIQDPGQSGWEFAVAAAPKLQDFLLQILQEDALMVIDKPELVDQGFESWRILVAQYEPSGGAYELDAMMALMTIKECKDMASLPAALARLPEESSVEVAAPPAQRAPQRAGGAPGSSTWPAQRAHQG